MSEQRTQESLLGAVALAILSKRAPVIVAVVALAMFSAVALVRTPVQNSVVKADLVQTGEYARYQELASDLCGDADRTILLATSEKTSLLTREGLEAVGKAARQLESLPQVERVDCIADFPWISGRRLSAREVAGRAIIGKRLKSGTAPEPGETPPLRTYADHARRVRTQGALQRLQRSMLQDPQIEGLLLSSDGCSQAMLVRLEDTDCLSLWQRKAFHEELESTLAANELGSQGVYSSGILITEGWIVEEVGRALLYVFPIGVMLEALLLYLLFRSLYAVAATLGICGAAITCGVGSTAFVFGTLTVLVAAAPLLIAVIATASVVYLISAYRAERTTSSNPQALVKTVAETGGACILATLTTTIGFASLVVIHSPTIRHLAFATCVGIITALLLNLTLVPMALEKMVGRSGQAAATGKRSLYSLTASVSRLLASLTLAWPRTIVALHLGLIAVALFFALRVEIGYDFTKRFLGDHRYPQVASFFNTEFSGTTNLELFISGEPEELLAPETLAAIQRLENRCRQLPEVRSTRSLCSLFDVVNDAANLSELPATPAVAEAYLDFASAYHPEVIRQVVDPDRRRLKVSVYTTVTDVAAAQSVAGTIDALALAELPGGLDSQTTGFYPMYGDVLRKIVRSICMGFAICFPVVLLAITCGMQSLRMGLISVLPNLFPLIMLAGLLAITDPHVESDVLIIPIIGFGLAVDDTVHFIHRFQSEKRRGADRRQALQNTYRLTGPAITRTTCILSVGLLPFMTVSYLAFWMLGVHLVFLLLCAVFGDLLLLPSLLLLWGPESSVSQHQHPNGDL